MFGFQNIIQNICFEKADVYAIHAIPISVIAKDTHLLFNIITNVINGTVYYENISLKHLAK